MPSSSKGKSGPSKDNWVTSAESLYEGSVGLPKINLPLPDGKNVPDADFDRLCESMLGNLKLPLGEGGTS